MRVGQRAALAPAPRSAARPARRVGATAILVDGELAVWVEPRGKRLATGALPPEAIELALAVGLPRIAAKTRRRELLIEVIDGAAAPESPLARALIAAGARRLPRPRDPRAGARRRAAGAHPCPAPAPRLPALSTPADAPPTTTPGTRTRTP